MDNSSSHGRTGRGVIKINKLEKQQEESRRRISCREKDRFLSGGLFSDPAFTGGVFVNEHRLNQPGHSQGAQFPGVLRFRRRD